MFAGEGRTAKLGFRHHPRAEDADADDTSSLSFDTEVSDVGGLISVIHHLTHHFQRHPEEWENPTLESFLVAMESILTDFRQSYLDSGEEIPPPDWLFFADVLRAGRVYE